MIVKLSSDAELDVAEGYRFYEKRATGLGGYFRDCIVADIESLSFQGGIHQMSYGYHRLLAKRFPFAIYYERDGKIITVIAVLDARRSRLGRTIDSISRTGASGACLNFPRKNCDAKGIVVQTTIGNS